MAQQTRKWNPGDAANAFVRAILSDAGTMLGGVNEDEWQKTLAWFRGRSAYTEREFVDGRMDRDHAIPMIRSQRSLHLYGNVLPATREANREKAGKHYRDFMEGPDRLERIESFVRDSEYWERVSVLGDLQRYCESQYRAIDALCRVNRKYLASLLPEAPEEEAGGDPEPPEASPVTAARGDTLPITLDPPRADAFLDALLRERRAWIVEVHRDVHSIAYLRGHSPKEMGETSSAPHQIACP